LREERVKFDWFQDIFSLTFEYCLVSENETNRYYSIMEENALSIFICRNLYNSPVNYWLINNRRVPATTETGDGGKL
jgi:hypothetical protein